MRVASAGHLKIHTSNLNLTLLKQMNNVLTPEEHELKLMEKQMIDKELTVEDCIEMFNEQILELKKEIDRLNLELQCLQIELLKERSKK
jgi:hypothetical protein